MCTNNGFFFRYCSSHVKKTEFSLHEENIEKIEGRLVMIADTSLWNDEVRIYEVTGLVLGIEEG